MCPFHFVLIVLNTPFCKEQKMFAVIKNAEETELHSNEIQQSCWEQMGWPKPQFPLLYTQQA